MAIYKIGNHEFDTLTEARAWGYRNILRKRADLMPSVVYTIEKYGEPVEDIGYTFDSKGNDVVFIQPYIPFRGYSTKIIDKQGKVKKQM